MRHILADYFLFVDSLDDKVDDFKKLAEAARAIGAESVEIPLVEKRTVSTASGKATTTAFLSKCLSIAEHAGIKIGLETDLPPEQVLEFIKGFGSNLLIPSYDSGNSASSGFDLENEFRLLGAHIRNIHIKDRMPNGGPTTPLGTGATKFKTLFSWLMANKYDGSLTLQAARRDGSRPEGGNLPETSWIASQAAFVRELLQ
jgi:hexulose-6-phosphate isomerase